MHGVMAPPRRYPSRPLMLATSTPRHPPRGLMSADAAAFSAFDLQLELTRLLWAGVAVLGLVLYLLRATR